ncbi:MAG TPA: hypothetical protein VK928_13730 [Longimicrobiales bacterium]|nr:hypothetical protein [Longimicrobiales bacterium]
MGRVQRFGIRLSRGWTVLLLLAALLVGAAYWIGPLRSFPAEFELAVVHDGSLVETAAIPGTRTPDGAVQFALPLAARNTGAREGSPRRVSISVPAQYRVFTRRGMLPGEASQGVPLRRYVVDLNTAAVPPDSTAFRLPGLDTVWLQSELPRYYCSFQEGLVPEFVPAPRHDPATLADLRIFYSVTDGASNSRNTGVLSLQLPPELLEVTPAPMPPSFRTTVEEPEARVPEFGALRNVGARSALCGDPQTAVELYSVVWETATGGRIFVVHLAGAERKRLYDLNDDGVVELETWDADGDGRFESRREARYTVPEFLLPLPPRDPSMLEPDGAPPDSAFLAVFRNTPAGPWRFAEKMRADSIRIVQDSLRLVQDSLRFADSVRAALAADSARAAAPTAPAVTDTDRDVAPPDPAWLRLFLDTSAGPFRFTRRPAPPPVDTVRADSAAAADTTPPPPPPPPRRPQPLGTPVPPPR